MAKKYTEEQITFLTENVRGRKTCELTEMFNDKFGFNLKVSTMRAILYPRGLKNGVDCRITKGGCTPNQQRTQFKKGHEPWNKGRKKDWIGGEETRFKKGHTPVNYRPVGSERINIQDYVEIKTKDPKTWRMKHVVTWEAEHGLVPKGCVVIFADGNRRNFDINNLILISKRQLLALNQRGLIKDNAELTKTGLLITDIHIGIADRKRGNKL